MPRIKTLPRKMPPITKELFEIVKSINKILPEICQRELESLKYQRARESLDLDVSKRAKHIQEQIQLPEPPVKTKRTGKKKIDLDAAPGDEEKEQKTEPEPELETEPETEPEPEPNKNSGSGKRGYKK